MGTRQNRLVEAVLTSTNNLCFDQKYEIYLNFSSENFHFLVVKVSLNRYVRNAEILQEYDEDNDLTAHAHCTHFLMTRLVWKYCKIVCLFCFV